MDSLPAKDTSIEALTKVVIKLLETSVTENESVYLLKRIIDHQLANFARDEAALYRMTRDILEMIGERLQDMYSRRMTAVAITPCQPN